VFFANKRLKKNGFRKYLIIKALVNGLFYRGKEAIISDKRGSLMKEKGLFIKICVIRRFPHLMFSSLSRATVEETEKPMLSTYCKALGRHPKNDAEIFAKHRKFEYLYK